MTAFRALLPPAVAVAEACDDDRLAPLAPEEEAAVVRAVEKRRAEFRAGRACARRALAELGRPTRAVPRGPDRGPVWPDGVVGAITHCDELCAAAVARSVDLAGLGIDAEVASAMTDEVLRMVTSPRERAMLAALPEAVATYGGVALFSVKESIHKAVHPRSGIMLDFSDVELVLNPAGELAIADRSPAAVEAFGPTRVELVAAHRPPHVLTAVVLHHPGGDPPAQARR